MELIDGENLSEIRLSKDQIMVTLDSILREISNAVNNGYVHSDLSEYNIFIGDGKVTIFDWPQAVKIAHINSRDLLKRDVENIIKYFKRKYPNEVQKINTEEIIESIYSGGFNQELHFYFDDT